MQRKFSEELHEYRKVLFACFPKLEDRLADFFLGHKTS
jgi:hypothetical protein